MTVGWRRAARRRVRARIVRATAALSSAANAAPRRFPPLRYPTSVDQWLTFHATSLPSLRRPARCAPRSTSATACWRSSIRQAASRRASPRRWRASSPSGSACRSPTSPSMPPAKSPTRGKAGQWDICFLAVDPVRAAGIAFTAPYVVIEGVYIVPKDLQAADGRRGRPHRHPRRGRPGQRLRPLPHPRAHQGDAGAQAERPGVARHVRRRQARGRRRRAPAARRLRRHRAATCG